MEVEKPRKELRIVVMSDTHGNFQHLDPTIKGDIFIHAGDFTGLCKPSHIPQFIAYLDKLEFKHKIVICGNNEIHFDQFHKEVLNSKGSCPCIGSPSELKKLLGKHCIYLQHSSVQIEGIRIFGSPCSQKYGASAFSYKPCDAKEVWDSIPQVDILITHMPPFGILDVGKKAGEHVGCKALRKRVDEVKPKIHIFGHIHESFGQLMHNGTFFVNASQCGARRVYLNHPITIDFKFQGLAKKKLYEQ